MPLKYSVSAYRVNFDDTQGFTDTSQWPITFGVGLKDRAELFGSFVVVNRREWVVTLTELRSIDHAALVALADGGRIADAARTAGTSVAQVWKLVRDWAALGFLQAIDQPTRVAPLTTGEVFP